MRLGVMELLALITFVGAVALVYAGPVGDGSLPSSIGRAVPLAAVPSLAWLSFVYRRDLIEPEPVELVLGIFFFGILLNRFLVGPILATVAGHTDDLPAATRVLVTAVVVELAKLAIVRFTVYVTDEFDEPADGIIYVSAAGLGFAASSSLDLLVTSHGVDAVGGAIALCAIAASEVISSCALGAGIGLARFARSRARRAAFLAAGLVAAILLRAGLARIAHRTVVGTDAFQLGAGAAVFAGTVGGALLFAFLLTRWLVRSASTS